MRVMQLIQKPQRRGAETFAVELAAWMRRQGHTVKVVALYPHDGEQLALAQGDTVLAGHEHSSLEAAFDPRLLARLVAEIAGFRPDVVQANGGRTVKYGALARRWTRFDALWIYRNIDRPNFWLKRPLARLTLPALVRSGFDAAVAVSKATLREVHDTYGFIGRSVHVRNGVDFEKLKARRPIDATQQEMAGGRHRLLWVGALGPQKRPDLAVELMTSLASADVSLTIVGEGPWRSRVESLIVQRSLTGRVVLLGNRGDVGDLMRSSDLCIISSDTEGVPGVAIEAMHCGLPVVGFDVGGMREVVIEDETGFLLPPGEVTGMAEAVLRLIDTPDLRIAMGRRAVDASVKFGFDVVGRQYLDFFESESARGAR